MIKTNVYTIANSRVRYPLTAAVVADLHGTDPGKAEQALLTLQPDLILVPGDLCEDLTGDTVPDEPGLDLLSRMTQIAPVFYSIGNHELGRRHQSRGEWSRIPPEISAAARAVIRRTGAMLLEDDYVQWNGLCIGGLTSGLRFSDGKPYLDWLENYLREPGLKLLLSHHPEYYRPYLAARREIDLIVSGHAHGGQWRIGKQGIYAPGQGLFPKYTKGLYHNRLLVTAGLGNQTIVPRLFNPPEIACLKLTSEPAGGK